MTDQEIRDLHKLLQPYPSESNVSQCLLDLLEARRLLGEIIHSHAYKNDKGGYFTDPHVYNECDESECMWCSNAKALLAQDQPQREKESV